MKNLANIVGAMAIVCALGAPVANAGHATRAAAATYPQMAPLSQYLIADRASEIALARSAAPQGISAKATIRVLAPTGYTTAVKGSNGFVCIVERSWMSPFNSSQFWNPKLRGPDCYNAEAAKSILPMMYERTALALRGQSRDQIQAAMKAALDAKQLPPLAAGAMSYMMSRQQYLGDQARQWVPHLMFYTHLGVTWGAYATGSPVILSPQFRGAPEPLNMWLIPVGHWSDGTPAPGR